MRPIIAIVGRPNVGKSTLFNRLIGGRKAITLDTPGVTRDRHYGTGHWDGREYSVIDTGGLFLSSEEGFIEREIRKQVDLAIEEASVILFVMDGQTGLIPDERELAQYLRRSGKKVFFVINKIDSPQHEERLHEFFELGEQVHPISSEHGYRVNDLLDEVIKAFPKDEELPEEKSQPIKVALLGLPNVGKSSLLNRLLGEDRVIVHNQPGTTRDAIDMPLRVGEQDYLLIDTAGIRRRGTWASKVERYSVQSSIKSIERADVCLLVMDAESGLHKQDAHVAGYIEEARKGLVLVWNKWDLAKSPQPPLVRGAKGGRQQIKKLEKKFLEETFYHLKFLTYAPTLFVSAKTGEGCPSLWPAVKKLYDSCGRRVATHEVNRVLEILVSSHNPPVYRGKPVKFSYATQTKTFPPTFLVFVNEPSGVHFSFKRYLINGFREAFQLDGAPIDIVFRRKSKR